MRILFSTDHHWDPRVEDTAALTLARFERHTRPEVHIFGGDIGTFDSVSAHESRSSISGAALPTIDDDIECVRTALATIKKRGSSRTRREYVGGNHDWARLQRWENEHPAAQGTFRRWLRVLEGTFDSEITPFGHYRFPYSAQTAGFTHFPLNPRNGKPYGGENWFNAAARDSTHDIICGHNHKAGLTRFYKSCRVRPMTLISGGCAMRTGRIEHYIQTPTTCWSYGVWLLTLDDLGILGAQWVAWEMIESEIR